MAEDKRKSLARIIAEINKKAEGTVIGKLEDMPDMVIERLGCGIPQLDEAMGGGFPYGRMVELYGLPSAGKSLICQKAIAEAQKSGREAVYVDCENSFDPVFAAKLGVDTKKLILLPAAIGEDIIDILAKLLEAEPAIIVVDSVASMITRAEMDAEMDQQFMAIKARLLSRGIAKLNALNKRRRTLIIFINQLRSVVTTWGGGGTTTPGGLAIKFFASIRIEVKRDRELITATGKKTDPDVIGQIVHYQITKNKTAVPHKYGSFKFFFEGKIE